MTIPMPTETNAARAAEIAHKWYEKDCNHFLEGDEVNALAAAITAALDEVRREAVDACRAVVGSELIWPADMKSVEAMADRDERMMNRMTALLTPSSASQPSALDDLTATPADGRGE